MSSFAEIYIFLWKQTCIVNIQTINFGAQKIIEKIVGQFEYIIMYKCISQSDPLALQSMAPNLTLTTP